MDKKYTNLLKNSVVLLLANFGSKILSFLLVPFYTYVLSTEEYGSVDILITTTSIIIPIVTISISEATLRFAMDKKVDKKAVLSISTIIVFMGNAIVLLFSPLLKQINGIKEYQLLFIIMLISSSFYQMISLYCRGLGYIKRYALGGLLTTATLIASNLITLLHLKMGITGYLISVIASYIIPTIYYIFSCKLFTMLGKPSKELTRQMIVYSIPMIPNALAWMIMAASDKYILIHYWGSSANGLYVVSQKIPSMLNIVNSIFLQSWQLSVVAEVDSKDKDIFYSNVFKSLAAILLLMTSIVTAIAKPLYAVWLQESYFESWKYITILMLANVFSCFSGFVGMNYLAMKKTIGNMKTTIAGSVVNIILNFILIPRFGIYAAASTTLVSFMFTWMIRLWDTKNFVKIYYQPFKLFGVCLIILLQFLGLFTQYAIIIQIPCVIFVCLIYSKQMMNFISLFIKRIKRIKK